MRRLVLLAATVRATSAALALPSVLTTRGHNATASAKTAEVQSTKRLVIAMVGATAVNICVAALNLASSLIEEPSTRNIDEALPLLRDGIAEAQRAFGRDNIYTFKFQRMYAKCLYEKENASLGDINKAVATLEDVERRERRVLGSEHPQTRGTRILLEGARDLARRHSDA